MPIGHWPFIPATEAVHRFLLRAQDARTRNALARAHAKANGAEVSRARAHEALARHETRPYGCGVEAAVREAPTEESA